MKEEDHAFINAHYAKLTGDDHYFKHYNALGKVKVKTNTKKKKPIDHLEPIFKEHIPTVKNPTVSSQEIELYTVQTNAVTSNPSTLSWREVTNQKELITTNVSWLNLATNHEQFYDYLRNIKPINEEEQKALRQLNIQLTVEVNRFFLQYDVPYSLTSYLTDYPAVKEDAYGKNDFIDKEDYEIINRTLYAILTPTKTQGGLTYGRKTIQMILPLTNKQLGLNDVSFSTRSKNRHVHNYLVEFHEQHSTPDNELFLYTSESVFSIILMHQGMFMCRVD